MNWGCIPTKALLKSASVFEYINHAKEYGIEVTGAKADFAGVVKRSRGIADGMSKGVQFLMKKNKIDVIMGSGKVLAGKKIQVTAADGTVSEVSWKEYHYRYRWPFTELAEHAARWKENHLDTAKL